VYWHVPLDNPKNTRLSINYFTTIGLDALTEKMREHLGPALSLWIQGGLSPRTGLPPRWNRPLLVRPAIMIMSCLSELFMTLDWPIWGQSFDLTNQMVAKALEAYLAIKERLLPRSLGSELEPDRSAVVKQCCMYDRLNSNVECRKPPYHYHISDQYCTRVRWQRVISRM